MANEKKKTSKNPTASKNITWEQQAGGLVKEENIKQQAIKNC